MNTATIDDMAKKTSPKGKRAPSRENYVYVYLKRPQAAELEKFGKARDRSLSWMAQLAVEKLLEELRKGE